MKIIKNPLFGGTKNQVSSIIQGESSTILDRPERKAIRGIRKLLRSLARGMDRLTNPNPWFPK